MNPEGQAAVWIELKAGEASGVLTAVGHDGKALGVEVSDQAPTLRKFQMRFEIYRAHLSHGQRPGYGEDS